MRVIAFLALLAGCAAPDLVKVADVPAVHIAWVRKAPAACGDLRAGGDRAIHGCAYRSADRSACVIWMPENAPDWVIAHEVKHCFGYEHAE